MYAAWSLLIYNPERLRCNIHKSAKRKLMAQQICHHTYTRVTVVTNSKTHYGVDTFIKSLSLDNS